MRIRVITGLSIGLFLLFSDVVAAQAHGRVQIQVADSSGRPLDGRVTVSGPVQRTCQTTASRCTLTLPAGSYRVTLAPIRGSAPGPRTIRVPASGTIRVALRASAARTSSLARTATGIRASGVRTGATTTMATRPRLSTGTATRVRAAGVVTPTTRMATPRTGLRTGGIVTRPGGIRPTTGTTTGGSTAMVTAMATTASSGSVSTRQTGTVSVRNLGRGSRLVAQGSVLDGAGRPTDGVVTIRQGTRVVGECRTTAGRFSVFDLARGTYSVSVRSSRGGNGRGTLTIGARVPRVVYRVP